MYVAYVQAPSKDKAIEIGKKLMQDREERIYGTRELHPWLDFGAHTKEDYRLHCRNMTEEYLDAKFSTPPNVIYDLSY